MKQATSKWLHGLLSAGITAFASSGLASLGITSANLVGVHVNPMDLKQLCLAALGGGIVGMLAYFQKSPLPPETEQ